MLNSTKQFTSDHTDSPTMSTRAVYTSTAIYCITCLRFDTYTHRNIVRAFGVDCSGTNCMGIIIFVDKPSTLPSCALLKHVPIAARQEEFIAVCRRTNCFSLVDTRDRAKYLLFVWQPRTGGDTAAAGVVVTRKLGVGRLRTNDSVSKNLCLR